jgi:hypothetical protein
MAGGDLKLKYPAVSTALTVTNLHSLASSQTWVAGWVGNSVNNTSNVYKDYLYGGTFTSHASNRQAGSLLIYVLAALNDTPTWPAMSSGTMGTEGTAAFADIFRRDSLARLLWSFAVDTTASAIYTFPPSGIAQLFGGSVPPYHCLFVTQNFSTTTTAGIASSGSALYYTPVIDQYT